MPGDETDKQVHSAFEKYGVEDAETGVWIGKPCVRDVSSDVPVSRVAALLARCM